MAIYVKPVLVIQDNGNAYVPIESYSQFVSAYTIDAAAIESNLADVAADIQRLEAMINAFHP